MLHPCLHLFHTICDYTVTRAYLAALRAPKLYTRYPILVNTTKQLFVTGQSRGRRQFYTRYPILVNTTNATICDWSVTDSLYVGTIFSMARFLHTAWAENYLRLFAIICKKRLR